LAGTSSLERGEDYAWAGAVRITEQGPERVAARVQGTRRYDVVLIEEDGELSHECSCPMGDQGNFCKHCVAVAVVVGGWGMAGKEAEPVPTTKKVATTMEDVREHLLSRDKPDLVELILREAREDDRLRDRLLLQVAVRRAGSPDVETVRAALHDAIEPDHSVSWRESWDWSRGVDRVVDSIEELLASGHARQVIDLCEEALEMLDSASGLVDDSDGGLAPLADRLGTLHLEACGSGAVDPVALGRRLVELELGSEHEAFYGAIDDYAEVLGEAGVAAYREAAEQQWSRVRTLGPGESDDQSADRFRLTHMMERLAEMTGGVDDVVAVLSRDLSHGYSFLRIAEVLRDAGRVEDALTWAERGLAAFPDRPDPRLREFAAEEHHRSGRHDEAMKLMWAEFEARPGLESYQRLSEHARVAGADWPAWSDRALAFLRRHIGRQPAAARRPLHSWGQPTDRTTLVEIFLWRNEVDAAWREAQEGGCRERLWLRLAELREKEHPEDAVPIYQRQVEQLVGRKNNRSYEDAVAMMRRVRDVMSAMDPPGDFAAYVAALRAAHRQKRNFIALLQRAGW